MINPVQEPAAAFLELYSAIPMSIRALIFVAILLFLFVVLMGIVNRLR